MSGRVLPSVLRIAPGAVAGAAQAKLLPGAIMRSDMIDGGSMRVTGIVTSDGQPAARRVRLHDQPSGRLLRETWSRASDGRYSFDFIRAGTYYAIALDHTGAFDPSAKADLVAEPMP